MSDTSLPRQVLITFKQQFMMSGYKSQSILFPRYKDKTLAMSGEMSVTFSPQIRQNLHFKQQLIISGHKSKSLTRQNQRTIESNSSWEKRQKFQKPHFNRNPSSSSCPYPCHPSFYRHPCPSYSPSWLCPRKRPVRTDRPEPPSQTEQVHFCCFPPSCPRR